MNEITEVFKFLQGIGLATPVIALIFLFYVFITNPEKIFLWHGKISGWLSDAFGYFEKNAVANNIRGELLSLSKDLNKELPDVVPFDLKIEWVKDGNREKFIQDNQIIVRMRHHSNQSQNVVVALQEFVEKGVMPKAKRYIDNKVSKSTDLAIVRRLILSKFDKSLDYFDSEILDPLLDEDDDLKELFKKIICLDESGMLTQVVLREFLQLGKKLYPAVSDDNIKKHTKEFINYLYKIATKETGEEIDLVFNRGNIKVGVVIIARAETFGNFGLRPHALRIKSNLNLGIDTIYVISPPTYQPEVKTMIDGLQDARIKDIKEFSYYYMKNREKVQSFCVALYTEPCAVNNVSRSGHPA